MRLLSHKHTHTETHTDSTIAVSPVFHSVIICLSLAHTAETTSPLRHGTEAQWDKDRLEIPLRSPFNKKKKKKIETSCKVRKKLVIVKQPEYRQENILLRSFTPVNAAISDPAACAGNGNHVRGSGSEDEETQSRRNTDHMPPVRRAASWQGWANRAERSRTVVCFLFSRHLCWKKIHEPAS